MAEANAGQFGDLAQTETLLVTLSRATAYAEQFNHQLLTPEHLLFALLEDSDAIYVLKACNVDVERLKKSVREYLEYGLAGLRSTGDINPPFAADTEMIIVNATAAAEQSGRRQIDGAILLATMIGDGRSTAAQILKNHGLTFDIAMNQIRIRGAKQIAPNPATITPHRIGEAARVNQPTQINQPSPGESLTPSPTTQPHPATPAPAPAPAEPKETKKAGPNGNDGEVTVEELVASVREMIGFEPQKKEEEKPALEQTETPPPLGVGAPQQAEAEQPPADPLDQLNTKDKSIMSDAPDDFGLPKLNPEPPAPEPTTGQTIPPTPVIQPKYSPPPQTMRPAPSTPAHPSVETQPIPPLPAPPPPFGARKAATTTAGINPVSTTARRIRTNRSRFPSAQKEVPPLSLEEKTDNSQQSLNPLPPPVDRRAQERSSIPGTSGMVEPGQLVENIPRRMREGIAVPVEVRVARAEVEDLDKGMSGRTTTSHKVAVTEAMTVQLRAPKGGFLIESATPETQWIDNKLGLYSDDFASWRFTITPLARGRQRLQLVLSARTVDANGMIADTAMPEQVIVVDVQINYVRTAKMAAGWVAAAIIGGILSHYGATTLGWVNPCLSSRQV